MSYKFVIALVAGTINTAADFPSRTEVNRIEQIEISIQNDIHTTAIVNIQSSSGKVEDEQFYILPNDENQIWAGKQILQNQAQNETHNNLENNIPDLQQFHQPKSGLHQRSTKIRLKQNNEIVIRKLRAKTKRPPLTEMTCYLIVDTNITSKTTLVSILNWRSSHKNTTGHFAILDLLTNTTHRRFFASPSWSQLDLSRHYEDDTAARQK